MAEEYLKAGQIAAQALKLALDVTSEGAPLIDIAEKIESFIYSRGGNPAFPVNISINEVAAHYSPSVEDQHVVPRGSIVKVDLGVHVDGYIADTAITIFFDEKFRLHVKAALEALEEAIAIIRPGIGVNDVAKYISNKIYSYGLRPIRNLTGHKVERYNLHAGKSIPNTPGPEYFATRISEGETFAIEPFATDGAGLVVDKGWSNIYRIISVKKVPKQEALNNALESIWKKYGPLPFSERWVLNKILDRSQLDELVKLKRVYHYPRLVEQSGGFVSQFEDTVIVLKDKVIPIASTVELYRASMQI
ncbi:MAG: type II methionyl aminopeptidase [Infirmifilum sp.]